MKRIFFCIAILILSVSQSVFAQNTGYMGRHFILKSDLMLPIVIDGYSIELEAVVIRRIALTGKFSKQQRISKLGNSTSYANYQGYSEVVGNWKSSSVDYSIGVKYYLEPEQPAPKGGYLFVDYGIGKTDLTGRQVVEYLPGYQDIFKQFDVTVKNVPVSQFNFGFGYQSIFFRRMVADLSISYFQSYTKIPSTLEDQYGLLSNAYGLNLLTISGNEGLSQILPASGINIQFKLGFLIF